MPLIVNTAAQEIVAQKAQAEKDHQELLAKRAARNAKRTKYTLIHKKDSSGTNYTGTKLILDGKEVEINDSMKFILEEMVSNTSNTGQQ